MSTYHMTMDRSMMLFQFLLGALDVDHAILIQFRILVDGKPCPEPQSLLGDSDRICFYNI